MSAISCMRSPRTMTTKFACSHAMPIRIAPKTLVPGAHTLTLSLRVDGGDPATIDVPVELDVDPHRRSALRPEVIAALFALLFLTLLFVIVRGMS